MRKKPLAAALALALAFAAAPGAQAAPAGQASALPAAAQPALLLPASAQQAQALSLEAAIWAAAAELASGMAQGARVAVAAIESDSARMANYVIDGVIIAFSGIGFQAAGRTALNMAAGAMGFQTLQRLSDEAAREAGRRMGADVVVAGSFQPAAGAHRLSLRAIRVADGAALGQSSATAAHDTIIELLLGAPPPPAEEAREAGAPEPPPPPPPPPPRPRLFGGAGFGALFDWDPGGGGAASHSYFGAFAFADTRFSELSAGLAGGRISGARAAAAEGEGPAGMSVIAMSFCLLFKLPVHIGQSASVFPLLGAMFEIALASRPDGGSWSFTGLPEHDTIKLSFGAGADFDFSERNFLRLAALGYYAARVRAIVGASDHPGSFGAGARVGLGFRL